MVNVVCSFVVFFWLKPFKNVKLILSLRAHTKIGCRLDFARGHNLCDIGQQSSEVPLRDIKKGSDSHFVF